MGRSRHRSRAPRSGCRATATDNCPGTPPKRKVIDMSWRHRAACRNEDPELFFPVGTTGPALDQLTEAKSVCRRCPVIDECLTWALNTGQCTGVWGGLGEEERHRGQRNQRISTRTYLLSIRARTDTSIGRLRSGSDSPMAAGPQVADPSPDAA
jgi:WhiB family transcriptional regulator, redox-sensing transcriptional regulator